MVSSKTWMKELDMKPTQQKMRPVVVIIGRTGWQQDAGCCGAMQAERRVLHWSKSHGAGGHGSLCVPSDLVHYFFAPPPPPPPLS
mmetsp:Transcript_101821/g.175760  ORF Transcript_101821/g.175760 Transcript_101821/m.175760 type:complete len:85 (-) Transcript_101821:42-296(-)